MRKRQLWKEPMQVVTWGDTVSLAWTVPSEASVWLACSRVVNKVNRSIPVKGRCTIRD